MFQRVNLETLAAIVVLDAPPEFEPAFAERSAIYPVVSDREPRPGIDFALAFAVT